MGAIDTHGLNAQQLAELMQAPRLRLDQADAVSRLLLREFPQLPLPTPSAVEIERIEGIAPVPCLTLSGQSGNATAAGTDAHLLALSFEYAGHRVPANPAEPCSVVDSADGMADIHRDSAAEAAAVALLEASGFQAAAKQSRRGPLRLIATGDHLIERASRWSDLLRETLPELELAGWCIETDDSFRLRFETGDWEASIEDEVADGNDWFGLRFDLEVDGELVPLLPIIAPLLEMGLNATLPPIVSVPLAKHGDGAYRFVDLPSERLLPVLETLRELFADRPRGRDGTLRMSRFDAGPGRPCRPRHRPTGGQRLRDLAQRLRDLDQIERVPPPAGLTIELRPYQNRGLDWLQFRAYQLAGILADDMGLGKTIQTLAHVLTARRRPVGPTGTGGGAHQPGRQLATRIRALHASAARAGTAWQ